MSLAQGTRIGPYEVVSMIGAGGMGEVYRARDHKLGRDVALKTLPAAMTVDADRRARFAREARVLATLNHPHIAAIYGFEEVAGVTALVLELVEGPTLADRLEQRPLTTLEAIAIARQVAEALEAAHAKGIVHRDLKPANVVVQASSGGAGTVKVLDFGVAKPFLIAGPDTVTESREPDLNATAQGWVLGTPAYMSPEQARGQAVDKQTDIWAFGCVLFEMLTRRRPFERGTRSDLVAQILEREPDWSCLPASTPEALRMLIQRCLRKDPDRRIHDIADARIELEDLQHVPHTQAAKPAERHVSRVVPWLIAAVSAGALVATLVRLPATPPHDHPVTSLEVTLPSGVEPYIGPSAVAISGDGARVAFVGTEAGTRQVYLREIDKFSIVPLRGTSGATTVFFSTDSRSVAFIMTDRTLKKVTLDDGLVVTLASQVDFTTGGSWGADDRITFGRDGVLWDIAASGGAATQLTTLDRTKGELLHAFPTAVGRNAVLFAAVTGANRDASHVESVWRESGVSRRHRVAEWATSPTYAGNGHLLFYRAGALLSAPFDEHGLQVTGSVRRVIDEVGVTPEGAPMFGVSRGGSVIYVSETTSTQLVWVARDGQEAPLTTTARHYLIPRVSPDGKRIAVAAGGDIWTQDAASPTFAKLTNEATTSNTYPIWLSDRRLVFRTNMGLYSVNADGTGTPQSIPETSTADFPNAVSLGGETLAFLRTTPDNKADLYALSLVGPPRPRPIVSSRAHEGGAQFSPDSKWLAYSSDESGHFQVFVSPYPALDRRWPVAPAGKYVVWNRNGKELFYRDGTRLMTVDVSTRGSEPTFSPPRPIFDRQYDYGPGQTVANYDVSADGQRFLMVKRHGTATRMNVVLNALKAMR